MPTLSTAALSTLANFDLLILRHGATKPPNTKTHGVVQSDAMRMLSKDGAAQCKAAKKSLHEMAVRGELEKRAGFALTSPAIRCLETARLVLGEENMYIPATELVEVHAIYNALLQPGAKSIFQKLSYAPLAAYLADGEEARAILEEYAISVVNEAGAIVAARVQAAEMKEATQQAALLSKGQQPAAAAAASGAPSRRTLCIFGHAVYSGAVAHLLASKRGLPSSSLDPILNYNMEEACGWWIGRSELKVVTHEMAPSMSKPAAVDVSDGALQCGGCDEDAAARWLHR